ncbi:hypothetical protein BRADI_2g39081v3 [Brachypodium distachyon]|uniref:Uncharacterized protein n=1 Tax=Brachypodium distachyon TaxID=15368 RepID=A0A0Q3J5V0_BRADI|nr:hypothetical protein BRADI_2g39081v3 [Brachypodium distachyon]KQK08029.1 hypothetical protein BRADI_2g39081v3 [Brachypodium distachyon]
MDTHIAASEFAHNIHILKPKDSSLPPRSTTARGFFLFCFSAGISGSRRQWMLQDGPPAVRRPSAPPAGFVLLLLDLEAAVRTEMYSVSMKRRGTNPHHVDCKAVVHFLLFTLHSSIFLRMHAKEIFEATHGWNPLRQRLEV